MHDRPTAVELLEAVKHFLETDVVPALEGTKKFHARVAANVMAILSREWQLEEDQLRREWESLSALLSAGGSRPQRRADLRAEVRRLTAELCERIRGGDADAGKWRAAVLAHVRQTVVEKLAVANPGMIGGESRSNP